MVDRVPVDAAIELGAGFGLTDVAAAGGLLAESRVDLRAVDASPGGEVGVTLGLGGADAVLVGADEGGLRTVVEAFGSLTLVADAAVVLCSVVFDGAAAAGLWSALFVAPVAAGFAFVARLARAALGSVVGFFADVGAAFLGDATDGTVGDNATGRVESSVGDVAVGVVCCACALSSVIDGVLAMSLVGGEAMGCAEEPSGVDDVGPASTGRNDGGGCRSEVADGEVTRSIFVANW